ncbi:uncharacterized protein LOC130935451 isoform X1 [Arachis stenosperma]|uniref:uncharacterized protein LOC130935451 isoform X1 n=1 Tax=Arachis stenosperma TaxID=217475 RepID=UPI0025ABF6FB|nr:uncharacterized protein LOC130935451 isoform X1 [Arachis stenosperma]
MPPIISRKPSSPPSCVVHDHHDEKTMKKQSNYQRSKTCNSINTNVLDEVQHVTRQRKLVRHLKDKEVFDLLHLHSTINCSCSSSCSRGRSSSIGCGHWSISAVPQPLPLPESSSATLVMTRRAESTGLGLGHVHLLGSPSTEPPTFALTLRNLIKEILARYQKIIRKTVNHGALTCTKPSSNLDRPSQDLTTIAKAKNNLRVHIPAKTFLAGNSSCKIPPSLCHYDENDDDDCVSISGLSMHVAAKSAPSSVLSSPVTSPHGSNNNPQHFFDHHTINNLLQQSNDNYLNLDHHHHHHHLPQANNNKNNVHICPASLSTAYSSNPKNNHVDAHPLPLPPRVSSSMMLHQPSPSSMKGQWQKGKLIGRGTFGSVYHATNLETGASCAMKQVDIIPDDPTSAECIKQLEQEIKILHQLHHPNIVQYYGSEIVGDHLYIYMEYVHPGSVNKFIREHCGAMTESVVRNFTKHILSGLAYLHSTKTIHRDIKGANLLVNESGIVKLADFGMAKILSGNSYELSLKGSPYWMAPEVMKAAIKNESNPDVAMGIDIWSLGCTIIEMLSGKPPWSDLEGPSAMFKVLQSTPPIPESLSSVGKDFLQQCFRRDPADRPSASMLLNHPFLHNFHDQDNPLIHPPLNLCHKGDQGQGDNSSSPKDNTKNRHDVLPASMSTKIFNKTQKLMVLRNLNTLL